jgi:PhnB protein
MGSDVPEMYDEAIIIGNNISISINTKSEEEADKIFNGLSAGGQVSMPMEKAFWGSYFGMLKDKFEINWMVSYEYSQQQS